MENQPPPEKPQVSQDLLDYLAYHWSPARVSTISDLQGLHRLQGALEVFAHLKNIHDEQFNT